MRSGRCAQAERFSHAVEQFRDAAGFRHAPAKRFARIEQGGVDDVLFFAALRRADFDLAVELKRQRFLQQFAIARLGADQDQLGRFAVLVKLRDEGGEDIGRGFLGIVAWKIGAVAPVLAGAEEKHLHAGLPAFLMQGEHVGFGEAWRD